MSKKNGKKMGNKAFAGLWGGLLALLVVVTIVANVVLMQYSTLISRSLGQATTKTVDIDTPVDSQYFKSDFASPEELFVHEQDVSLRLEGEGAVLLMNKDGALPLKNGAKLSLFGQASASFRFGGGGSGAIDETNVKSLKECFEMAGFQVNGELWDTYKNSGLRLPKEVAPADFSDKVTASFSEYGDTAVFVFSRPAHEATDLAAKEVELTKQEKEVLDYVSERFDTIVVLVNAANAVELGWLNDYSKIKAALWIGYPGQEGLPAVPQILAGTINPSGRLVDTYANSAESSAAFQNFGYGRLTNGTNDVGAKNTYVIYGESIYVGYRYYETRYEDTVLGQGNAAGKAGSSTGKAWSYADEVLYPFGYGLSYTTFDYSDFTLTENGNAFTASVKVTNTGSAAGKHVVQLYFQSPFTDYDKENLIEKSAIELCGYAKTSELQPGASETVTITVPKEELRAYDYKKARTYIVDAGTYYFTVADNAHAAVNNVLAAKGFSAANGMDAEGNAAMVKTYEQAALDTTTYAKDGKTGVEIVNRFDYANITKYDEQYVYLTRQDWEGTWPSFYGETDKKGNHSLTANDALLHDTMTNTYADDPNAVMPTTGSGEGINLITMRGRDFDDPEWEKVLDCLTVDEMISMVRLGGWQTAECKSVSKPLSSDQDGPAGISDELISSNTHSMGYPIEVVLSSTWNDGLVEEMGKCVGEDGLKAGVHGWYAPGAGTHRTPYGGRNFEYYSEDGFLAGKICAAEVRGVQSKGMYVYLKHLVLNDQEDRRYGINTFPTEQAMREIYMVPFEFAVKEADAHGMMAAFDSIGGIWCGANHELLEDVLRGEWGFHGIVVTDYATANTGYMWIDMGLQNGGDLWLNSDNTIYPLDGSNPTIVNSLRRASKNILYTVVNSSAMNGISETTKVVTVTPPWQYWLLALDIFVLLLAIVGTVLIIRRCKKNRELNVRVETKPAK